MNAIEYNTQAIRNYRKRCKAASNARLSMSENSGSYYVIVNPGEQGAYVAIWQRGNYWDGSGNKEPLRLGTKLPTRKELEIIMYPELAY